jgi:hypothetical protein
MLIDSKSQLAKLMATENIFVEQKNVPTAYFNTKTRQLVIPELDKNISPDLYDLLFGHEVGHALFTPEDGWHHAIVGDIKVNKTILNVCEDARIEKLIKRKYPGLKHGFFKGYKELIDKDFFRTRGVNMNSMNLVDRINMYFKQGAVSNIKFEKDEIGFVDELTNAETFEQIVDIAIRIQAKMKQQAEEKQKQKDQDSDDDQEFEMSDDQEFDDSLPKEFEDSDSDDEFNNPVDQFDDEYGDESSDGFIEEKTPEQKLEESLKSFTDEAFREKEKELFANNDVENVYANIPTVGEEFVVDYRYLLTRIHDDRGSPSEHGIEMFQNYRKDSNKVVGYLAKEFELKKNADQLKRASVAKTGELNMNRIYQYKFSEDLFKKISVVPNGKSHGLIMYLDWSGSMTDHLTSTIKQLINIALFCRKVNIPFEVYAFSSDYYDIDNKKWNNGLNAFQERAKAGDLHIRTGTFSLLNLFSNRMNNAEFSRMAQYLLAWRQLPSFMSLSSTPLNEAVVSAFTLIPKFKEKNKLQIVNAVFLTDGEGHNLNDVIEVDENGRKHAQTVGSRRYGKKSRLVFRDPKTGAQIAHDDSNRNWSVTPTLLSLLKQRTGANLIGFYLLSSKEFASAWSRVPNSEVLNRDELRSKFTKEKSIVVTSAGFDEYYWLRTQRVPYRVEIANLDEDEEFEVKSNTTRGLVTAFKNYNKGRLQSRAVLNRFVNLIT